MPLDHALEAPVSPAPAVHALPLFAGTGAEATRAMLQDCPILRVPAGGRLLNRGQPNRAMFVLLAGRLSVRLEGPDGPPIASVAAGETVGELSLLDRQPTSAWVIAEEASELLVVDEATFWRVVSVSHSFCVKMMLRLSERLRCNNVVVEEHSALARRFEQVASFDTLTGARSRRWIEDTLPRIVERHRRDRTPLSVAMLDVDHFKRINDTLGHMAGDAVLSAIGGLLTHMLRPSDTVARYGGEEFLVVLPGTTGGEALACVERLRTTMEKTPVALPDSNESAMVTFSAGIAELGAGDSMDGVVSRADRALYDAKRNGRNRSEVLPGAS